MKKHKLKFKSIAILALLSISLTISCSKKGDPGQQGEKGDTGAVGAQGIAGADGSVMLSGNGVPATTLGKNGDFYLDKNDATMYGPKTDTGWGAALVLKGAAGANGALGATGAVGSQMLSGVGAPASGLGANGDFYFDKQNLAMYGPKSSGNWGTATALKNPDAVVTLLYKNQAFSNIVKNTQNEASYNSSIANYNQSINTATASINQFLQQYNQMVAQINANNTYTAQQKQDLIAQTLTTFNNNTVSLNRDITDAQAGITYYQNLLSVGEYNMSSSFILDTKYKSAYDDGLMVVRVRPANSTQNWVSELSVNIGSAIVTPFASTNQPYYSYAFDDSNNANIGTFNIIGFSRVVGKTSLDAVRYDVKVVLIAPTSLITMSSKGVDTKNTEAILNYLNQ